MAPSHGLKHLHGDIQKMIKNIFFSRTAAPNRTIFSIEHPLDKEISFVQIKSLGSYMTPPEGLKLFIY